MTDLQVTRVGFPDCACPLAVEGVFGLPSQKLRWRGCACIIPWHLNWKYFGKSLEVPLEFVSLLLSMKSLGLSRPLPSSFGGEMTAMDGNSLFIGVGSFPVVGSRNNPLVG